MDRCAEHNRSARAIATHSQDDASPLVSTARRSRDGGATAAGNVADRWSAQGAARVRRALGHPVALVALELRDPILEAGYRVPLDHLQRERRQPLVGEGALDHAGVRGEAGSRDSASTTSWRAIPCGRWTLRFEPEARAGLACGGKVSATSQGRQALTL